MDKLLVVCLALILSFAAIASGQVTATPLGSAPKLSESEESEQVHQYMDKDISTKFSEEQLDAMHRQLLGGALPAGINLQSFQRHGLNETCNNKMCEMLMTSLSCKALPFHLSKICAKHLLGFFYSCSDFPAPIELYDAPSVCIGELLSLLPASLAQGVQTVHSTMSPSGEVEAVEAEAPISNSSVGGAFDGFTPSYTLIKSYLKSNYTENCKRRCFQTYLDQANDFYGTCDEELAVFINKTADGKVTNTNYPLVYIMEPYQEFKNQICAKDTNGSNCFNKIQGFLPDPANPPIVDVFKYDCNYFDNDANDLVFQGVCEQFENNGCCFGNQVAMLAQSQTNQSALTNHYAIKMFPPCLLKFLETNCSHYTNPREFCSDGANGNMTTISGSVQFGAIRTPPIEPVRVLNIYDEKDVVQFSGLLSLNLLWDSDSPTSQAALDVEVLNYAYFNDTIGNQSDLTQITPLNGSIYQNPFQGDFVNAVSGRFDFQIVVQGLNATGAAALQDSFLNTGACSSSGLSILGIAGNNPVCVSTSTTPTMFLAKPITPTPKSGSCRSLDTVNFAVTVVMLSSAVVYALM